jgi:hypothetical protein
VGIILFFFTFSVLPTTINGRFIVLEEDSSKFTVLLQINTNTGTDDLGGSTIVFNFDTTAISFTAIRLKMLITFSIISAAVITHLQRSQDQCRTRFG